MTITLEKQVEILDKLIHLLGKEETKLDMDNFTPIPAQQYVEEYKEEVYCGTACCIAGYIPLVDPEFASGHIQDSIYKRWYAFESMSKELTDTINVPRSDLWDFCFHDEHSNNKSEAISRLKFAKLILQGNPNAISWFKKRNYFESIPPRSYDLIRYIIKK